MKKLAITIAIVLGLSMTSFAQWGGGLFQRGAVSDEEYYGAGSYFNYTSWDRTDPLLPGLPNHGYDYNTDAPIGGGALLLIGFGAAYALKKRKEKK